MISLQSKSEIKYLSRLLRIAMPDIHWLIVAIILAIVLAILGPLRPWIVQHTIDDYIILNDKAGLLTMTYILVLLLVLDSMIRYGFSYLTSWLGQRVVYRLRTRLFHHILHLRLRYFDTTPVGTTITRTIGDVETINDVFSEGLISIVADILTLVFIIGFMLSINVKLTLVSLATLPLLLYGTYWFKESVKKSFHAVRNQIAKLNAFTQEHITGMAIVQWFTAEDKEYKKFKEINAKHRDEQIKTIWAYSIFFPLIEILLAVSMGLIVWYGSILTIDAQAEPGVIIAFIMLINMLFRPLRVIADTFNTLQMGLVAAERVFLLLDLHDNISNTGILQPTHLKGAVKFENVNFSYDGEREVLHNINIEVQAGKVLAIIGATGAGKSSIINILNRQYEITSGNIYIDDHLIHEYELSYLRKHIGFVLQDVFLFTGSILENIRLHDKNINEQEIENLARMIGVHDFIMAMPNGYQYMIQERGNNLSAGQRQILSFMRCMAYKPSILILDEATSSIDTESERIIQQAISNIIKGRTSIVIAHRLSTIQHANNIIVLEKGRIIEQGNPAELIQQNSRYAEMIYSE